MHKAISTNQMYQIQFAVNLIFWYFSWNLLPKSISHLILLQTNGIASKLSATSEDESYSLISIIMPNTDENHLMPYPI